jgi:hypothetical protein
VLTGHKNSSAANTDGVGRGGYPGANPLWLYVHCRKTEGVSETGPVMDPGDIGKLLLPGGGFGVSQGSAESGETRFELVFRFFFQIIPIFATNKQLFADFRYCHIHTLCIALKIMFIHFHKYI